MKRSDMSWVGFMQRIKAPCKDFHKMFFENRAGGVGAVRKKVQKVKFERELGLAEAGLPRRGADGTSSDNRD